MIALIVQRYKQIQVNIREMLDNILDENSEQNNMFICNMYKLLIILTNQLIDKE